MIKWGGERGDEDRAVRQAQTGQEIEEGHRIRVSRRACTDDMLITDKVNVSAVTISVTSVGR